MDKKPENIGDLGEFFNIIGKAKKQKEDEFRSVVGDIDLDGIAFLPTDDYSVSGTTLTFVESPASGAVISVRYLPT